MSAQLCYMYPNSMLLHSSGKDPILIKEKKMLFTLCQVSQNQTALIEPGSSSSETILGTDLSRNHTRYQQFCDANE
jgi:hypothetical protein